SRSRATSEMLNHGFSRPMRATVRARIHGRPSKKLCCGTRTWHRIGGMKAIIIGAGRGQRLMPTTAETPKCYAEVQGRRLLDWALGAFAGAEITDVTFIGGYQIDRVRRDYPQLTFRHNSTWENNNILASLMHAEDLMGEGFICC